MPPAPYQPDADFMELLGAASVGVLDYAGFTELHRRIQNDPESIRLYVRFMLLSNDLDWELSDRESRPVALSIHDDQADKPTPTQAIPIYLPGCEPKPSRFRPHHFALAIAAALLVAGIAVAIVSVVAEQQRQAEIEKRQTELAARRAAEPVATLIESTGGNLTTPRGYPSEGRDYPRGEYALDSGTAEFMLTNAVNVQLRGETSMVMHNDMNVSLTRGSAEFVCPADAKGFTVHLSDGSKVRDLGTAFGVAIDDEGRAELHVTKGMVEWMPSVNALQPVLVAAGQIAHMIDGRVVVSAKPLFVDSFESPPVTGLTNSRPTGWGGTYVGGINHEDAGHFDTPFGEQALWLNQGRVQTSPEHLSHVLEANTTYALTVNVARRSDLLAGDYRIDLLAGDIVLATATGVPTRGDFSETVAIAFTPDETHADLVGQPLAIRLATNGNHQPQFDNVRLEASPVSDKPPSKPVGKTRGTTPSSDSGNLDASPHEATLLTRPFKQDPARDARNKTALRLDVAAGLAIDGTDFEYEEGGKIWNQCVAWYLGVTKQISSGRRVVGQHLTCRSLFTSSSSKGASR